MGKRIWSIIVLLTLFACATISIAPLGPVGIPLFILALVFAINIEIDKYPKAQRENGDLAHR